MKRGPSARVVILALVSFGAISAGALVLLLLAVATLFCTRRLYAAAATRLANMVLRLWGIRVVVHQDEPFPWKQTVYVSNHTSTLDLFVLVALGLPNTRFFLSGFLRKYVPLGIIAYLMGTFFTVPQNKPAQRTRIFQRADRILRRTRESVYLSPEGGRITTGTIGPFNKGSFHLATSLRAPIVPLFIHIPSTIDPGLGYNARPGTVHVYVKPAIDTTTWRIEDLETNTKRIRDLFVQWHREIQGMSHGEPSNAAAAFPAALEAR